MFPPKKTKRLARPRGAFLSAAICLFLSLGAGPLDARDWYVTGNGNNSNNGATLETAFATLARATHVAKPGDTVWVGDGTYSDAHIAGSGNSLLTIAQRGSPEAWTTWKAIPGTQPLIRPSKSWQGILITGAYVIVDGFIIIGANESIKLEDARADALIKEKDGRRYHGDPRFNTNGIIIDGRRNPSDKKPHHVIIRNCMVGKMPGGGISVMEGDHVTIEDCVVFGNAWYMRYAGSGITTLNNWQHDDAPGYHIIVHRNLVWDNKSLVPWAKIGKLSDGNGILLDVTDGVISGGATNPNADAVVTKEAKPAKDPTRPEWTARALIANNVSAFNGGSGIHTFRTKHVDIINNTTYWNGAVVGYEELFANRSEDIVILNNIIVPRPKGKVTSDNRNTNIRWDYNLYPRAQSVMKGKHDIVADPMFEKIDGDLRTGGFRPRVGSRAINRGVKELISETDVTGAPRLVGKAPDIGAYEQQAAK